jgi:hypothetical protein
MIWRKILKLVFPIASLACLNAGFAGAGQWIALLGVLMALLAWLAAYKWGSGFFPTTALVLSIGLGVAGLMMSAPPVWMLLGSTFACAGWDILLFQNILSDDLPAQGVDPFEKRHYRNLTMALGLGLLFAVAGSMVRIQIPFGWMIVLAAVALFGLERLWRNLKV